LEMGRVFLVGAGEICLSPEGYWKPEREKTGDLYQKRGGRKTRELF